MGDLYDRWKEDFDAAFAAPGDEPDEDLTPDLDTAPPIDLDGPPAVEVGVEPAAPEAGLDPTLSDEPEASPHPATSGQAEPEALPEEVLDEAGGDDTLGFDFEPGEFPQPFYPRPVNTMPEGLDPSHMVNVHEAALILGFTPSALAKMRLRGTGPVYYKSGVMKNARILYKVADLHEYRDSQYIRVIPAAR